MATIDVDGHPIVYRQSAGGDRTVVLVHSNSSSSRTWEPLLAGPFGQRLRCLAIDLPGHGDSPAFTDQKDYSLPSYAALLIGFAAALDVRDAVFVGWSLGGHIVLEAAPALNGAAAGLAVFGTPPVGTAADLATAFLPNPAMALGFTAALGKQEAEEYAASFVAPGSTLPLAGLVNDILVTDGAARAGIGASIAEGRFADEIAITRQLTVPLAVLHGRQEQFVSLDYLRGLSLPTLWRNDIQVLDNAGHAPHEETPDAFASLLELFVTEA